MVTATRWYNSPMTDDPIDDGFEADPRIDAMVRKAGDIAELILNAEFLLGEYVAEFLKSDLEIYEMACELRLTPEQRCRLVIHCTGVGLDGDQDDLGKTFALMLAIYQARTNLGRLTAQESMDALGNVYARLCFPGSNKAFVLGEDPLANIRYAVAGHLIYAERCLQEAAVLDPDDENEAE